MDLLAYLSGGSPARRLAQTPAPRGRGFTLVELLATLAVAAVLLAVAVPSFNHLIISNRLTAQANDVVNRLAQARSEAVKRGTHVEINADGSINALPSDGSGDPTPVAMAISLPAGINAAASVGTLVATPLGLLRQPNASTGYSGLVVDLSSNAISSDNHRCIYLFTGTSVASCTDSQSCKAGSPHASCH